MRVIGLERQHGVYGVRSCVAARVVCTRAVIREQEDCGLFLQERHIGVSFEEGDGVHVVGGGGDAHKRRIGGGSEAILQVGG